VATIGYFKLTCMKFFFCALPQPERVPLRDVENKQPQLCKHRPTFQSVEGM
jgi:hypothetical protein